MLHSRSNGQSIVDYIPPHLRNMFFKNPAYIHASHNGLDPYGFSTEVLVFYTPLWALKDSAFKSIDAYQHKCTVSNSLWGPDGRLFDGDDYIAVEDSAVLSFGNNPCSFGARINPTDATSFDILSKGTLAGREYSFSIDGNDKLALALFDVDNSNKIIAVSNAALTGYEGTWVHLFATYDGTDENGIILYVSGVAVASTNTEVGTYVAMHNYGDAVMGRFMADGATYANGTIGEEWVYAKELSPAAVLRDYNTTKWRG